MDEDKPDLAYGAQAIAAHLSVTVRQARHLVRAKRFPTWKAGKILCARRSTLNAWLAECEAKARAGERP